MLRLQRWKRGWSRSFPAVDAKLLAGPRDENRLDMIDRRRPQPWTHILALEIIHEDLLIILGKCVLLVGYRGEELRTPVCLLTEARSSHRAGYEVVSDQTRLILTKRQYTDKTQGEVSSFPCIPDPPWRCVSGS